MKLNYSSLKLWLGKQKFAYFDLELLEFALNIIHYQYKGAYFLRADPAHGFSVADQASQSGMLSPGGLCLVRLHSRQSRAGPVDWLTRPAGQVRSAQVRPSEQLATHGAGALAAGAEPAVQAGRVEALPAVSAGEPRQLVVGAVQHVEADVALLGALEAPVDVLFPEQQAVQHTAVLTGPAGPVRGRGGGRGREGEGLPHTNNC